MILKTLWIQRICGYEGEYVPECLVVTDEYGYDENPDWFNNKVTEQLRETKDIINSYKIINIEVDQEQITKILNDIPHIKGEIK